MQGIDNYKYAQWVIIIGRSLRINPAAVVWEKNFISWFLYQEILQRPWLETRYFQKSESLQGLVPFDNTQVAGKLVEVIGRDMMKIPILNILEKENVDNLVIFTEKRKFGVEGGGISPGTNN